MNNDNFYLPQREAQRLFLERHPDNKTAVELVANQRHEAELYSRYSDYYGYVFYVARRYWYDLMLSEIV